VTSAKREFHIATLAMFTLVCATSVRAQSPYGIGRAAHTCRDRGLEYDVDRYGNNVPLESACLFFQQHGRTHRTVPLPPIVPHPVASFVSVLIAPKSDSFREPAALYEEGSSRIGD
jgi:hypothetical protein